MNATPKTRSDIISLLSEACELEHGLACSYLYAAFSIKQSATEGNLTWEQVQYIRKWAGQIYFIASQEMFHLSQAWNLLTAIGGTPYYMRPNFPQGKKYYPLHLKLALEPFGKKAMRRFIFYELPSHIDDPEFLETKFGVTGDDIKKAHTVGELYDSILAGILSIDERELFIGDPSLQVGPETCHFNDIVKVTDRTSTAKAIQTITEQGEGTTKGKDVPADQVDCHYGLFVNVDNDLCKIIHDAEKAGKPFVPSRPCISNPVPAFDTGQAPADAKRITNPFGNDVSALFDNVYSLMLRILQYVFQSGPLPGQMERQLANTSIQMMARVLKPLGEALTLIPAGPEHPNQTCGPSFGLYRHVSFPKEVSQVIILVEEGLLQISEKGKLLANHSNAPVQLSEGVQKLEDILQMFRQSILQSHA
ncbi:MAG: ferritin-like domain-containing protein [Sphingobacteriales bacterium]